MAERSDALKQAQKRYYEKNKERLKQKYIQNAKKNPNVKYNNYKSYSKTFISELATDSDLKEMIKMIENKLK